MTTRRTRTGNGETGLGPCCICQGEQGVRNVIMLHQKAPVAGHGWGCVVCHLPSDGAIAVLCDKCFELFQHGKAALRFACRGYPGKEGRVPAAELAGEHDHDHKVHEAEQNGYECGILAQGATRCARDVAGRILGARALVAGDADRNEAQGAKGGGRVLVVPWADTIS